ncbi:MAG: CBS domain-containing protein [Desulfurococcales archaeon]|nr:CBS domain-containing protein [Desulfurococcales archaeon]
MSEKECVKVEEIMSTPPISVGINATVLEVARLMKVYGIGSVIIVDENDRPIAIFTEKELVWSIATFGCEALDKKAYDHSVRTVPVVRKDSCIEEAVKEMDAHGLRHAAVVDEYGRLVGVVSMRDIAKAIACPR